MSISELFSGLRKWWRDLIGAQPPVLPDVTVTVDGVEIPGTLEETTDAPANYRAVEVWVGNALAYKLVGLQGTVHGLIVTTSNVYRGENRSEIWRDGERIYRGGQETIGQPFVHGADVFFPVEHGSHVLRYDGRAIWNAAKCRGRWSVAGVSYAGMPLVAFNDRYSGGVFQDCPVVIHAETGEDVMGVAARCMLRSFAEAAGKLWMTGNFGQNVLANSAGGLWQSDALVIAELAGRIYGGGGMNWGPIAARQPDGKIYCVDPAGQESEYFRVIGDTGCASIQAVAKIRGELWFAGVDPDRLFVMGADERLRLVVEIPGETAADKARDFGAGVTEHNGEIYWGRSDGVRPHVYRIEAR